MAALLDTGAWIALDKGDRGVHRRLTLLIEQRVQIRSSAVVLAEVWRGGRQANVARNLASVEILQLDEAHALQTGALLGRSRTHQVADAHLALLTQPDDVVLTSDAADIEHLLNIRGVKAKVVSV